MEIKNKPVIDTLNNLIKHYTNQMTESLLKNNIKNFDCCVTIILELNKQKKHYEK